MVDPSNLLVLPILIPFIGAVVALLLRHRRRPASRRVARVVMAIAWCGMLGFAAYHVVEFVRELV